MEKQTISIDAFTAAAQNVKERDYWMQKLSGGLTKSCFLYDNSKNKTLQILTCKKDPVSICFSGEVFSILMKMCRGQDHTLHLIAVAVIVVLLDKYANNDNKDIIVGVPIYRQDIDSDMEFVNTVLALRVQLNENMTFKELLLQVRQTMLEADENKNYPIDVLVSRLNMSIQDNDFPLFDVAVILENIHDTSHLRPVNINIIFCLMRTEESVELGVQYNTSRYERATVQRIVAHFNRVLQQVLFNVDIRLPDVEITTEEEKRKLLKDFNNSGKEYPFDKTIHELFSEQVSKSPDSAAVIVRRQGAASSAKKEEITWETVQLTYRELNEKSDQLAHVLRKKGVKSDAIVGLMVKRSVEMVIGLLGILKAGAAYLPIDPNYPQERKRYMQADCNAALLLTACELLDVCRGTANRPSLCQGTACCAPTNLAYVIYTSGSTGKPKGVLVEQQNVVRLVKNTNYIEFRRNDRILQTGALAFDASTFEIWGSLLNGITLCLVPEEDILDPEMLKHKIWKYNISTMWLTSSLFNYLCSEDTGIFAGVKNLLVGGDVLSPLHINRARERFPGLNIVNGYGPTENTTFSATYEIRKNFEERIPIGKPIANSTAYILDRYDNLVPVGVGGELYVGGDGVSRGYLNNPELTAEKFDQDLWDYQDYHDEKKRNNEKFLGVQGPFFKKVPGRRRLYKTGDLARWLADGNIEFIGRIDHQAKIRGFRIEPGEIESRLLSHHLVKEAVVLVREEESGDKYICAYIVTHQALAISELREYLSEDFPDYLIPSYFFPLEKIPLTANGKVDRAALPIPEVEAAFQSFYSAPRNQLEQTLIKIWSKILNLAPESLGINANFFEVGGHSLRATIMIAQIHQELNVKVPLTQVFVNPTIRELAQYIKGVTLKEFTAIPEAENKNYYALSSAQKRLFVLQQLDSEAVGYNIPMAVTLEGELDKQRLETTFWGLIRRHESLRTSFEMIQKKPVQKIHAAEDIEFSVEYFDLDNKQKAPGNRVEKIHHSSSIIHHSFIRSFDLSHPPLLRVGLIKEGDEKNILVVDMHHIVSDGTSMGVLVKDFMALYSDPDQELSKLRIQYKDFSEWENRLFLSQVMMTQQSYWLEQFENEIPVLSLPTDYSRPGVLSFEGASISGTLEGSTVNALKQLALKTESTLFMVLAALYNLLLSKLSTQEDILMGTPIAGRNHADLQEIIGMFVNTLVLRNFPQGNKTVIQFLKEVKERVLEALENQDYPFEKLVDQLSDQLERDSSRNPLFDTMFTLQTMEIPEIRKTDLKMKPYAFENKTTKFDISFTASEIGEGLLLNIDYSIKLFKNETVMRFLRYFESITLSVIENPQQRIGEIQFLTDEEKQQLLFDFNDTYVPYPWEKTICQLFAEQVSRTPDSVAVIGGRLNSQPIKKHRVEGIEQSVGERGALPLPMDHVSITYNELDKKSNQLAHQLQEKGVQPDSIVGIMVERSIEMIIEILGILKTGGAYLPIDPEYPEVRIQYMLKDSNARVLVSEVSEVSKVSGGTEVIDLSSLIVEDKDAEPTHLTHPTHLCYVIYTSGSTGRPKGVMVEHASVVNLITALQKAYPLEKSDAYLLKTNYTFDVSAAELFGWYLSGGRLAVLKKGGEKDAGEILETIKRERITHVNFVPSMFHTFVECLNKENVRKLSSLRYIFLAGEALSSEPVLLLRNLNTSITLENIYGPTESTVYAARYSLSQWNENRSIPIGKPLQNIRIYILDKAGHLQTIGVPGELCLAGIGLSRGYVNRPELTAEKFDHDLWDFQDYRDEKRKETGKRINKKFLSKYSPTQRDFSKSAPDRRKQKIYKTGDLARWLPDGNIEFLGRMDFQVKIRGYRIELGEIENCLSSHPHVKEAVVLPRANEIGNTSLCAYVTLAGAVGNPSQLPMELKNYLSQSLPNYMIPAHFVQMEKIPITAIGKIDRKVLPQPVFQSTADYIMPKTFMEKRMAGIWRELLGVENVGVDDNFFELGGNSLNLIQLGVSLKEALQIDISTVLLFRFPTIRTFLGYLQEQVTGLPEDKRAVENEKEREKSRTKSVDRGKRMMKQAIGRRERRN